MIVAIMFAIVFMYKRSISEGKNVTKLYNIIQGKDITSQALNKIV
jgi:hypothetical protein